MTAYIAYFYPEIQIIGAIFLIGLGLYLIFNYE
jgi:hypothetical protein